MVEPDFDETTAELARRARSICLALPEAREKATWGHPTFRVRDKIFASFGVNDDGIAVMTMKAAPGEQEVLLAVGEPFFIPAYVGSRGWIGVKITDTTDWAEIDELVTISYLEIAPKRLGARVEQDVGT